MICGCGIDVEELVRFRGHTKSFPDGSFVQIVLSQEEIQNFSIYDSPLCLPLAFSCKEAMFKALGMSWTTGQIDWKDIRLFFDAHPDLKQFHISFSGYAKQLYEQMGKPEIESTYEIHDDHIVFEIVLNNE